MNELLWLGLLLFNFIGITIFYRFLGKVGLFIWIPMATIIANIQVLKLVELFGVVSTLGNIVYASSFLVTDILSENYGKKSAQKAVVIGFFTMIASVGMLQLSLLFIPASDDWAQPHLQALFGLLPRIMFGSITAFAFSQLHDVWAYDFWKRRFPDTKFIWLRNNASTMVSQLIDTAIFTLIAFAYVYPPAILLEIALTTYLFKWVVAALDTPFIYLAVKMKKSGVIPSFIREEPTPQQSNL